MPFLSEGDYKTLIIGKVNDASGQIAARINTFWNAHQSLAGNNYLRYLYAWREAVQFLMGEERRRVNYSSSGDLSVSQSDLMKNLQAMLDEIESAITAAETKLVTVGRAGGAIGQLTTTTPVSAPTASPDANDRAYRGDPYLNRKRRG